MKKIEKQKLWKTLVYECEFIVKLNNNTIKVKPKKGTRTYLITKNVMKKAFDISQYTPLEFRFKVYPYRNEVVGPSYVATFLYHCL